ncbi:MAG TPA: hypothetical protein DCW90_18690 [Lachnospiraceae bacterium]|nr:hypothetical protein [Lachnospiraceae bacterium]
MALIDNMYLFVETEDIAHKLNVTSNPTERGIDLTDHAEREPIEMSVTGMLLDSEKSSAYEQYTKLRNWQLACKQVKFVGRNVFTGVITDISKNNDYTVGNGAKVSLTLKEIRIANTPYQTSNKQYVVQKQVVTTKPVTAVYHTTKKGENLTVIAKKYGTTVNNLMALNPSIKNRNLIYVNQRIRVK